MRQFQFGLITMIWRTSVQIDFELNGRTLVSVELREAFAELPDNAKNQFVNELRLIVEKAVSHQQGGGQ